MYLTPIFQKIIIFSQGLINLFEYLKSMVEYAHYFRHDRGMIFNLWRALRNVKIAFLI